VAQNPEPKRRRAPPAETLSPEAVAAWLRQHPDFLADNPDLLFSLTPPDHDRGKGVVDFQRFLVDRQRRELEALKGASRELLAVSRTNKATQQAVHKAALALLAAPTFGRAIATVVEDWAGMLDADVVMMGVESAPDRAMPGTHPGLTLLAPGDVDSRLGRLQDVRVISEFEPPDPAMFGEAAGLAKSVVWLRLSIHESVPQGLLAIGSREPKRFHPRQNTELLRFLASTLAVTIRAWLNLAEPQPQNQA
jgi:uncharacterized protein YigA (DUF484 family)